MPQLTVVRVSNLLCSHYQSCAQSRSVLARVLANRCAWRVVCGVVNVVYGAEVSTTIWPFLYGESERAGRAILHVRVFQ